MFAGSLRVPQALRGRGGRSVGVWRRAACRRWPGIHSLAAADLVAEDALRPAAAEPETSARLDLMARLVTGGSAVRLRS